jgi:hypothetical protein
MFCITVLLFIARSTKAEYFITQKDSFLPYSSLILDNAGGFAW